MYFRVCADRVRCADVVQRTRCTDVCTPTWQASLGKHPLARAAETLPRREAWRAQHKKHISGRRCSHPMCTTVRTKRCIDVCVCVLCVCVEAEFATHIVLRL